MKNRFKPVRVRDPRTDGYRVCCHPCQEFIVELTDPRHFWDCAGTDDHWKVNVFSHYFFLAEEGVRNNKQVFRFVQYYNLQEWVMYSDVFIGDIEVELVSKTIKKKFSLCVMVRRNANERCRVVTAVDCDVNRLKIDLDTILEVVTTTSTSSNEAWCDVYDKGKTGCDNGCQWFEKVRQETILCPSITPRRLDSASVFYTLPRDIRSLPKNRFLPSNVKLPHRHQSEVYRQQHFWFRIRPEDRATVAASLVHAVDSSVVATVVCNNQSSAMANLQLLLNPRVVPEQVECPEFDKIRYEGTYRGLVGRYYRTGETTSLMIDPGSTEGIEMLQSGSGLIVELPPPFLTWPFTDESNKWMARIESPGEPILSCQEITSREINNRLVQRFSVKAIVWNIPDGQEQVWLGSVKFHTKEPDVVAQRTLNCWLVRERTKEFHDVDVVSEERFRGYCSMPSPKNHAPKRQVWSAGSTSTGSKVNYTPPRHYVQKIKVNVKEFCDNSLMGQGIKSLSFRNIQVEAPSKSLITTEDYDRWAGYPKKKEGGVTSPATNMPLTVMGNTSQSRSTQKASESQKENGIKPSLPPYETTDRAAGTAIVVDDPKHLDIVTVSPGQHIVFHLPIRYWDMKNDVDYFWNVNPLQHKEQQFFIREIKLVRQGRKIFQEVIVLLCNQRLPRSVGNHRMGGIMFSNVDVTKFVLVELKVTGDFAQNSSDYSTLLRYLMEGWKLAKKDSAPEEPQASKPKCVLVQHPWPQEPVQVEPHDSMRISLEMPPESSQHWTVSHLPVWLHMEKMINRKSLWDFHFEVDGSKAQLSDPEDKICFKSDSWQKTVNVRLKKPQEIAL